MYDSNFYFWHWLITFLNWFISLKVSSFISLLLFPPSYQENNITVNTKQISKFSSEVFSFLCKFVQEVLWNIKCLYNVKWSIVNTDTAKLVSFEKTHYSCQESWEVRPEVQASPVLMVVKLRCKQGGGVWCDPVILTTGYPGQDVHLLVELVSPVLLCSLLGYKYTHYLQ